MLQDYRPVVMGVIGTDQRSPGPGDFIKEETSSNATASSNDYDTALNISQDVIERYRRRRFAHYDCQSLVACLKYAAKLKESLEQRQNIVTGASAAHDYKKNFINVTDDVSNELIQSCQYFVNEIGGEIEKDVSLSRVNSLNANLNSGGIIHKPCLAYGVSILDLNVDNNNWKSNTCPCTVQQPKIDFVDHGSKYYRDFFYGKDHQNFLGTDDDLGPVVISVKKEKCNANVDASSCCYQYRQIMKLDEQAITNKYKVGILYCKKGQSTEEEMYNNEQAGPEFMEFLEIIGKKVRLKGFENYKGGLDTKTDSTGLYSLYTSYENNEIMFHVSTMLPFMTNNKQQILRKRHIGNDIVTIIFQEPGSLPFSPKNIRSQFQHVFIIVRAVYQPYSCNTYYQIAVSRSKDVPIFGPPLPNNLFSKNDVFYKFLLTKIINAENAAHKSTKFYTMATRTRQEYLKDLIKNFSSLTPLDTHVLNKFSIFQQKPKKVTTKNTTLNEKIVQTGAYCWDVVLQDQSNGYGSIPVNCLLGISFDTFVLMELKNKQIVGMFEISVAYNFENRDVNVEIIERLKKVTQGCSTVELNLKRDLSGHLGFHVQSDGVVTKVDSNGQAWLSGLRPGYRIVEICKIVVATLSYDQLVDLLKTCDYINITVIESSNESTNLPRTGCYNLNILPRIKEYDKYDISLYTPDKYETDLMTPDRIVKSRKASKQMNRKLNFSPPRSSNSSGYGTSSSSRSFGVNGLSSSVNISKLTTEQNLDLKGGEHKYLKEVKSRPKSIHDPTDIFSENHRKYPFNNSEINGEHSPNHSRVSSNNPTLEKVEVKVNRKKSMNTHLKKHSTFQKDLLNLINPDYEDNSREAQKGYSPEYPAQKIKEEYLYKLNNESVNKSEDCLSVANKAISDGYLTKDENKTMDQLQAHLNSLETQILKDKQRRKSLEDTVQRLSEENRRLQSESEAAVQQLRTFTEWFFQTIDKKLD
uniref:Rap-GAP domain-containing protein n=1 Tax=Megaselia scalaris TaxID=36166 RepID=T1GKC2_MEGSC